jgi:hypothetical protein
LELSRKVNRVKGEASRLSAVKALIAPKVKGEIGQVKGERPKKPRAKSMMEALRARRILEVTLARVSIFFKLFLAYNASMPI